MAVIWNGNGLFLWWVLLVNSPSVDWIVAACMEFERNIAPASQKRIFLSVKVTIDAENTSFSYLETFITVTVSFTEVILPIPSQAVYNLHFQIFLTIVWT